MTQCAVSLVLPLTPLPAAGTLATNGFWQGALMTRMRILEAALALTQSGAIDRVDVRRITAAAGVTARAYAREFADDTAFLEALHGHHVSLLVGEIGSVIGHLPAGRDRLVQGIETYWQGCIERIPTRRLIKNGRKLAQLDAAIQRRNRAFEYLLQPELQAIGLSATAETARLLRTLIEEVAQAEYGSGVIEPPIRQAFWRMFDATIPPAVPPKKRTVSTRRNPKRSSMSAQGLSESISG